MTCQSYTLPKGKGTFNDDFHVFGLYWDEHQLYTYLDTDDQRILEVKFDQPFFKRGAFDKVNAGNPWQGRSNCCALRPALLHHPQRGGGRAQQLLRGRRGRQALVQHAQARPTSSPKPRTSGTLAGQGGTRPCRSNRSESGNGRVTNLPMPQPTRKARGKEQATTLSRSPRGLTIVGVAEQHGAWIFGSLLLLVLASVGVAYGFYLRMGGFPSMGGGAGGAGGGSYTSVSTRGGAQQTSYQAASTSAGAASGSSR